jgi:hypothetical protein
MKAWASKPYTAEEQVRSNAVDILARVVDAEGSILDGSFDLATIPVGNILKSLAVLAHREKEIGRDPHRDELVFGVLFTKYWPTIKEKICQDKLTVEETGWFRSVISLLPDVVKLSGNSDSLLNDVNKVVSAGMNDPTTLAKEYASNTIEAAGELLLKNLSDYLEEGALFY